MKTKNIISQNSLKHNGNIDIRLLVTPFQNKKIPVYNWFNYKHSFSRDLVIKLIDKFQLDKDDRILDPFCGSGTTLLAAKELGISARGIDILPFPVFITNAKITKYNEHNIKTAIKGVEGLFKKKCNSSIIDSPKRKLLKKFFPEDTLDKIIFIRRWIKENPDKKTRYFLLMALLSILEDVSYTRKDGAFLRILKEKRIPDLKFVYLSKLNSMAADIKFINKLAASSTKAIKGDARRTKFNSNSFSAIITSPPYPNRHDYTRVYLLELMVGFVETTKELKNLRYYSIRSHVEGRKKFIAEDYNPSNELNAILRKLEKVSLPNRQIIPMLSGYFEDMYLVMKEVKRLLKPNGKAAFVIGDVRYGGIKIPVCNILMEIGNNVGLDFKEKIIARTRGNSPQQMEKYGREPMEESILIWEKK